MGSVIACCAYSCNCCICDCCLNKYLDKNGIISDEAMFDDDLGLVIYDIISKKQKLNPIYENRENIFKELQLILNNHRIDNNRIDEDLIVADIGCGTGNYTKIICDTFITSTNDQLLCIDISPKCLQFIREKIVNKNKMMKTYNIKWICNNKTSLCLPKDLQQNNIDLALLSFTLYHIKKSHSMLQELYQSLKQNGVFVIFEFSPEHFTEVDDKLYSTENILKGIKNGNGKNNNKKYKAVSGDDLDDDDYDDSIIDDINGDDGKKKNGKVKNNMFQTTDELKQFISSFGFKFEKMIKHLYDNQQWIFIFRK